MSSTDTFPDLPGFDRSLLPDVLLEFAVIGDTHYILDPEPYAVEFASVREWPERAQWALALAASLKTDFAVHLGDLAEENPAKPGHREARRQALLQMERVGLAPHHVAGNMDIGDKPDPTMWSAWVTPETLGVFHEQFGRSWYSFDHGDLHFAIINSQILNSDLPAAAVQHAWLEADLAAADGRRIFLFMHMPPFFVDEDEPDTGFYNSINEPARGWIAGLARQHRIELLFAGHTHFRAFNRIGPTRLYVAPSTTTSRAGFYEAFAVGPAPEQGRNDRPKLGFYLVRVGAENSRVHLIRTGGEREPKEGDKGWQRLLTRTSHDLAASPVGVLLRLPLAHQSAGALAWPSALRQRVRDDHPFLSCLDLGVRHVRVPRSDLDDPLQSQRLQLLREEGVTVTGCWLWSQRLSLAKDVARCAEQVDFVELQVPGELYPDADLLQALAQCRAHCPVVLTPVLAHEPATGKYHPRTRFGYRADELPRLDEHLSAAGVQLDRVLCHVDSDASPWDAIRALCATRSLAHSTSLDIVVGLPGVDEALQTARATAAVFAAALAPDVRLFLDPLVDLDRTNDVNFGLLDRLSNPRPAFHAVRCLNSILFGMREDFAPIQDAPGAFGIKGGRGWHWLVLKPDRAIDPPAFESDQVSVYDLVRSMSRKVDKAELGAILAGLEQPCLIRDFFA